MERRITEIETPELRNHNNNNRKRKQYANRYV